ncbi:hypothetical protein DFH28DRAFT_896569 [Melampsora americana]|nr:hypothetical protein DFH28DRAFT_896569 [Melampsora americana]
MPPKGRTIQCPLGPSKKKRKQDAPEGLAQVVAELQANESRWVQNRVGQLEQAIAALPQVDHEIEEPVINPTGSSDEEDSNKHPVEQTDNLLNNSPEDSNIDGAPPNPNSTFGEYIRGSYYKKKQLVAARNWTKVLGPMFLTYMICSRKTSQWGNNQLWSLDRNMTCSCGVGDIRTRKVDMVDLLERKQEVVTFCNCTSDQVRLVRKGYIGGSPVYPETAYSIRLLRFHHILWKYCTVRTQGFALALDEFLDASNVLILAEGSNKPRRWRRTFSLAIDAYRHMLRLEDKLSIKSLKMTPLEQLAKNCPRCFGPLQDYAIDNNDQDEAHYVVCVDGNFQHRRHKAASQEYKENEIMIPSLFIDPKKIVDWEVGGIKKNKDAIRSVSNLDAEIKLYFFNDSN